jgi:hypothetical protein
MTGTTLDYNTHCKLPFGAYVETHEMNTPTNTMKERTRAAICLCPTANFQGSYKFLCLRTGRRITRKQFKELPMPKAIIEAVEALTERDKQDGNLEFTNRDGSPYTDSENATNQPTDGDAGVDTEEETESNEPNWEPEPIPEDLTGVTETTTPEIPGVAEQLPGMTSEIPGVQYELPGVANELS